MPEIKAVVPPPVAFDLDAAERTGLYAAYNVANGGRLSMAMSLFVLGFQSIAPIFRLYRYRGSDPIDWALLAVIVVLLVVALSALAYPSVWQRLFLRSQFGTVVTFDDFGMTIVRGGARPARAKRVALADIRSVRQMPEALFIFGGLRPIVMIPLRAVPDGGAQIMSYFEERLVATRMLRRSSLRTTIVNTVSP